MSARLKVFHPAFGVGTVTAERVTESGQSVMDVQFADAFRSILSSVLTPVEESETVRVRRAGVASPRVKSVATEERRRPRPSFEKKV
jgi:hypothetical protein